jgi:hypothetical protein
MMANPIMVQIRFEVKVNMNMDQTTSGILKYEANLQRLGHSWARNLSKLKKGLGKATKC